MTTWSAENIGRLAIKMADAALLARSRHDDVNAILFATKAAECLQLAKHLGWKPGTPDGNPNAVVAGDGKGL